MDEQYSLQAELNTLPISQQYQFVWEMLNIQKDLLTTLWEEQRSVSTEKVDTLTVFLVKLNAMIRTEEIEEDLSVYIAFIQELIAHEKKKDARAYTKIYYAYGLYIFLIHTSPRESLNNISRLKLDEEIYEDEYGKTPLRHAVYALALAHAEEIDFDVDKLDLQDADIEEGEWAEYWDLFTAENFWYDLHHRYFSILHFRTNFELLPLERQTNLVFVLLKEACEYILEDYWNREDLWEQPLKQELAPSLKNFLMHFDQMKEAPHENQQYIEKYIELFRKFDKEGSLGDGQYTPVEVYTYLETIEVFLANLLTDAVPTPAIYVLCGLVACNTKGTIGLSCQEKEEVDEIMEESEFEGYWQEFIMDYAEVFEGVFDA